VGEAEVDADLSVVSGSTSEGSVCTTNEAKYRPAASLTTVTDDGSDGSSRDQRTATSPTFGRRSFPAGVMAQRSDLV
jgi:hypothetical protein